MRSLLLFAAVTVLGCATSGGAEAPRKEFVPVGEVGFSQSGSAYSASFSEDRVVSPEADLSRTGDGSWRGRIGNAVIDVNVYPDRLAGSGLTMKKETGEQGREVYTAQVDGQIFRFELDAQKALIRAPRFSATLPHNGNNTYGPGGILQLRGEAVTRPAPWPQLGLSLLAAFASATHSGM